MAGLFKATSWIRIRNLDRYQHYKTGRRSVAWVKLYCRTLQDRDFMMLPVSDRWLALGLLMLAPSHANRIPNDLRWLRKVLSVPNRTDLENLKAIGFIEVIGEDDSRALSQSREREGEKEKRERDRRDDDAPPAGSASPSRESMKALAWRLIDAYQKATGWPAPERTIKALASQMRKNPNLIPEIESATTAYLQEIHRSQPDKRFRIKTYNFFGREQRWREYLPSAPMPIQQHLADTQPEDEGKQIDPKAREYAEWKRSEIERIWDGFDDDQREERLAKHRKAIRQEYKSLRESDVARCAIFRSKNEIERTLPGFERWRAS